VNQKAHWEQIYNTKSPEQMSWFEAEPTLSLMLIQRAVPNRDAAIIDVGAGAATLVDDLLTAGYHRITVLDLSGAALAQTQRRLSDRAATVSWREGDILTNALPANAFDLWHDRAAFHFLTDAADRSRYVAQVRRALRPGGFVLIATFAEDGPERCSGLQVARYSPTALHTEFGDEFRIVTSQQQTHRTPWGAEQSFTYCLCQYEPHASARDPA